MQLPRLGAAFGCAASVLIALAGAGVVHAECRSVPAPNDSRTLVLALDGVPLRVVEQARKAGAFAGWAPPRPLVAPFPSVTNVSFTVMFEDYGVSPAGGYEVQYYDWERNDVVGGTPFGYKDRAFDWREYFDVVGRSLGSKLAVYTTPGRKSRKELQLIGDELLADDRELLMVHVGSTDAMQHILGDRAVLDFLLELDDWGAKLAAEHAARFGQPLRVVLLSDHGNSSRKISGVFGVQQRLREHGLRVRHKLERPDDVVAAPFGLVGFGAIHTAPSNAATVAAALTDHRGIDIVAWQSAEREISLRSGKKRAARIHWTDGPGGLRLAYLADRGDPLRLHRAESEMARAGLLDERGFAADLDWLRATEQSRYPDALRRLVDAFAGHHTRNRATVLFSAVPGRSWGWKSAHFGSWLRGGRLEGTHGGLDRDSSIGFVMSLDGRDDPGGIVRAADVLRPFLPAWKRVRCRTAPDTIAGAVTPLASGVAATPD